MFRFLFISLAIGVTMQSHAAGDCGPFFEKSGNVGYGQLKPEFKHDSHFDVDLTSDKGVRDQCGSPFCHLFTWTAALESSTPFEISSDYLSAAYLYRATLKALKTGDPKFIDKLAASGINSLAQIREIGVIPQAMWQGRTDFLKEPAFSRLLGALQSIVATTAHVRSTNSNPAIVGAAEIVAEQQIVEVFQNMVGQIPDTFEYEGASWTPVTFAQKYFPKIFASPMIRLMAVQEGEGRAVSERTPLGLEIAASAIDIERTAKALLDLGQPVWLGYENHSQFVDLATGIMSLSAFNYPDFARPLPRTARMAMNIMGGSHAVLLVGYELDPVTKRVLKWKVQNSWGEVVGVKGFFILYADYFNAFVTSITYLDNGAVPVPSHYEHHEERGFPNPPNGQ